MKFLLRFPMFLGIEFAKVALIVAIFASSMILANPELKSVMPTNFEELKIEAEFVKSVFQKNLMAARGIVLPASTSSGEATDLTSVKPSPDAVKGMMTDLNTQLKVLNEMQETRVKKIRELEMVANGYIPDTPPSNLTKLLSLNPSDLMTAGECRRLAGFDSM